MSGYGIEPDPVYGSGRNIHNMGDDARSAGNSVMSSIADAAGVVQHPLVSSALKDFHADNIRQVHALGASVEDCGGKIAMTANICVDGENEQTAAYSVSAGQGDQTYTSLNRQI
jgi:hypothetical protein